MRTSLAVARLGDLGDLAPRPLFELETGLTILVPRRFRTESTPGELTVRFFRALFVCDPDPLFDPWISPVLVVFSPFRFSA